MSLHHLLVWRHAVGRKIRSNHTTPTRAWRTARKHTAQPVLVIHQIRMWQQLGRTFFPMQLKRSRWLLKLRTPLLRALVYEKLLMIVLMISAVVRLCVHSTSWIGTSKVELKRLVSILLLLWAVLLHFELKVSFIIDCGESLYWLEWDCVNGFLILHNIIWRT